MVSINNKFPNGFWASGNLALSIDTILVVDWGWQGPKVRVGLGPGIGMGSNPSISHNNLRTKLFHEPQLTPINWLGLTPNLTLTLVIVHWIKTGPTHPWTPTNSYPGLGWTTTLNLTWLQYTLECNVSINTTSVVLIYCSCYK